MLWYPGLITFKSQPSFLNGVQLRYATSQEADAFTEFLRDHASHDCSQPYVRAKRDALWGTDHRIPGGDSRDHYYAVIVPDPKFSELGDYNNTILEFEQLVTLMDHEPSQKVAVVYYPHARGFNSDGDFRMPWPWQFTVFDQNYCDTLDSLVRDWQSLDRDRHHRICRACKIYYEIRRRENMYYPLWLIGMMSCIECLLTHSSSGRDDSISRQVSKKIPLVLRRAGLGDEAFGVPLSEAWRALYTARSIVAHGGELRFDASHQRIQQLNSIKDIMDYMRATTKALLIHAMAEPDLICELAEC